MTAEPQRLGHYDGDAEDGVKRFRRPPDFERSIRGDHVQAQLCVTDHTDPAIGETIEIDGERYEVRHSTRLNIDAPLVLDPKERYVELLLDDIGVSPYDPLLERARAQIEALGATVDGLSATREGMVRHVSIHAVASWPTGMTADVYGTGPNDRDAVADLAASLRQFAP